MVDLFASNSSRNEYTHQRTSCAMTGTYRSGAEYLHAATLEVIPGLGDKVWAAGSAELENPGVARGAQDAPEPLPRLGCLGLTGSAGLGGLGRGRPRQNHGDTRTVSQEQQRRSLDGAEDGSAIRQSRRSSGEQKCIESVMAGSLVTACASTAPRLVSHPSFLAASSSLLVVCRSVLVCHLAVQR